VPLCQHPKLSIVIAVSAETRCKISMALSLVIVVSVETPCEISNVFAARRGTVTFPKQLCGLNPGRCQWAPSLKVWILHLQLRALP